MKILELLSIQQELTKKKCKVCGIVHLNLPRSFRKLWENDPMDGVYFECKCGTTMFIPRTRIEQNVKDMARTLAA